MKSRLVGRPNVSNILAAAATAVAMDLPLDAIAAGVAHLPGVPGRFEVVSSPDDEVTVVVDYAHTDDALRNLLETARPLAPKRLMTVFGCGGDRDRTKRPLMGMVAARLSDVVVITSDNPRSEDPLRIIDEIKRGIPAGSQSDGRRTSARSSIVARRSSWPSNLADAGDVVLIAGKGHEKYQQIGDRVLPFDDARDRARGVVAAPQPPDEGELSMAAMVLTAAMIASATGGYIRAGAPQTARSTASAIDSRTLQRGRSLLRDRCRARRP